MLKARADLPRIVEDEAGGLRLTGTRVTLDSILAAFEQGATPEEIALRFPTARLADVYAVIAWTLDHQSEVASYVRERESRRGRERAASEARFAALRERVKELEGEVKAGARLVATVGDKNRELELRVKELEGALEKHKHTDECFEYAARTAADHGNYYCIAKCSNAHREALSPKDGD